MLITSEAGFGYIVSEDYSEQHDVSIYNLSGQKVFDLKMRTGSRVDVSNLEAGLYLIWVSDGIAVSSQKLLVK